MIGYTLIFSLILGSAGAWFMSRYAYRFGLLDIPNDRSSHDLPIPRGGGIGILLAFVVSSLLINLPLLIWLPAAFLALVSLFDDKLDLTPKTRLIFQFLAAFAVVGYALVAPIIQNSEFKIQNISLLAFVLLLSVYVVGTANFYNFMDGINGIAGVTGTVGFALLGFFAVFYTNAPVVGLSAFCISLACLGFLPLNMPQARVFMGDVGSILLGFVFASYVVILSRDLTDFFVLAGFLSTFYADTLTTLYVRKRNGERLSQAHRRHLYQLFANQKKVSHWKVSVCYGLVQSVIGLILLTLWPAGWAAVVAFELLMMVGWWMVMMRVRKAVESQLYGF